MTRMRVPKFAFEEQSNVEDLYLMLSIELLSGKLLNQWFRINAKTNDHNNLNNKIAQ